jgi:hypothetical protein
MMYTMCVLEVINTNIGIIARLKFINAEFTYYNQVWQRESDGVWKQHNLFTRINYRTINPGFLEALYQNLLRSAPLPYEDWW